LINRHFIAEDLNLVEVGRPAALGFQVGQGPRSGGDVEQELRVEAFAEANRDGGVTGMGGAPVGQSFLKGLEDRRHAEKEGRTKVKDGSNVAISIVRANLLRCTFAGQ
jgi:hypothetical protein